MANSKKMPDEQRAQIAELIRQGKKIKEIQQALGVPAYRVTLVRQELSEQEAYRAKDTKKMLVRKGFWDEWNAARNTVLHPKEAAQYAEQGFWDEWDMVRRTLLKAKRKEAAG